MPTGTDPFLLSLLQACAESAPQPLYPARFAAQVNIDRDKLDHALDELRKRGLVQLTEWVKDLGQGYALTEAGRQSLRAKKATAVGPHEPEIVDRPTNIRVSGVSAYERGELVRVVFLEPATPYVSRILLALNILYFGYGALLATREPLNVGDYLAGQGRSINAVLIELGALSPPLVLADRFEVGARPEYERLILFLFLHCRRLSPVP